MWRCALAAENLENMFIWWALIAHPLSCGLTHELFLFSSMWWTLQRYLFSRFETNHLLSSYWYGVSYEASLADLNKKKLNPTDTSHYKHISFSSLPQIRMNVWLGLTSAVVMLSVLTQMVPTPVSVWRTTSAMDAPAGPGEPRSPRLSCTSNTNSPKDPSYYNLHLRVTSFNVHSSRKNDLQD